MSKRKLTTGCAVVFDPQGNTDFVFPNFEGSAGKRTVKTIRRM